MTQADVEAFVNAALEASLYVQPTNHGLSRAEIMEVATSVGYRPGEVDDALKALHQFGSVGHEGGKRYQLASDISVTRLADFLSERDPEYRNVDAFDVVARRFRELAREFGKEKARASRTTVVAQACAGGVPETDIEVAITIYALSGRLTESAGILTATPIGLQYALPSEQVASRGDYKMPAPHLARAMAPVRDVISRRSDGRPPNAEPLDAYGSSLGTLNAGQFKIWWDQTLREFRSADPMIMPTSACVLAAALAEVALAFVVRKAQASGVGTMEDLKLDEPKKWRFEDLLRGAAKGKEPILDGPSVQRGRDLNLIRQRIHGGRLLANDYGGHMDTRPEEARDAQQTCELIVRKILDWLHGHPA